MFPASTKGGGVCMGFPDVCKVPAPPAPPIPTPFPNIGQLAQADGSTCTQKIKIENKPALTLKSEIPMTSGDEAGSAGGLVSGKIKGPVKFIKGSTKVIFEGTPAVFLTSMTGQNGSNANVPCGNQVAPSQAKVICMG